MANSQRLRLSRLLELLLDAVLLLLFMAQAFVGGCLAIYGYLPLPTEWGNQLIAHKVPPGLTLQVDAFRIRHKGTIELVGLDLKAEGIQQSLFEADAAELELSWPDAFALPAAASLVLSDGTLHIPSVYSPDGYKRALLQRIAFRLLPGEAHWTVDRFAALHADIHLRGAFQIPIPQQPSAAPDIAQALDTFYHRAAELARQTERFRFFKTPTIAFNIDVLDSETQQIDLRVSSPSLAHPEVTAEQVLLEGSARLTGLKLTPIAPPHFSASRIEVPRHALAAAGVRAVIEPDQINGLLDGEWPQLQLAAGSLALKNFQLDAPILDLDPRALPALDFRGATGSQHGAIHLDGRLHTELWNGEVHARGSVDLVSLVPPDFHQKLPRIEFESTPHYDLQLRFEPGFALDRAELKAQVNNLRVEGLRFDHINARASYQDGRYAIDELYLRREAQSLDLKFSLDSTSKDYRATLIGSVVPNDYNALLPHWWAAIFEDFDFSQTTYSLGDFIIYGNTGREAADLYYGRATARGVSYKGVHLDSGELIVRGRGTYTELRDLAARSGQGWARGHIAFASKLDEVKGPASIRLDMEAQLSLDDAAKLFAGDIADIIRDFQTDALPETRLQGAIFNSAYPQYAGKSYFDLSATCAQPLSYKGIPLDDLRFDLFGRSEVTHLRNVSLGYASGQARASIDIFTPQEAPNRLRYQFTLQGADRILALCNLPQFDGLEKSLRPADPDDRAQAARENARADLWLHGEGPVDAPFKHAGFGRFEIRDERLGTVQLLGPLSRVLQNTLLNFTSFNLGQMRGEFRYADADVFFDPLRIDGSRTQITAPGRMRLTDQSLDMRVSVSLFGNAGDPDSNLRKIGDIITRPIPNLLEFELTGTVQEQKLRSLYDPRNFIPRF